MEAKGGVSYSWKGPDNFTSTSATPSILVADKTKHEGTYTVIVTSDKGCTATATTSVVVNTNPNPVATTNGKVCLGADIKLSVTAGSTYLWTGDGFSSTVREPVITSTKAGTFTYTVTVSGNGGCTGTATTSVIVNALPTATATGTSVCTGTEIKVNVTPTFASYAWTGVNNFTASTQNPTVNVSATAANTGTYQVTVTDGNGCTAIATTSVTVNANPCATASSNTPICAGTTLNLVGGGGGT